MTLSGQFRFCMKTG